MADGGRADSIGVVETAARMLAAGYGTGSFLRANVAELGIASQESRGEVVGVAWRGTREESAAKRIGDSGRASAMHAPCQPIQTAHGPRSTALLRSNQKQSRGDHSTITSTMGSSPHGSPFRTALAHLSSSPATFALQFSSGVVVPNFFTCYGLSCERSTCP